MNGKCVSGFLFGTLAVHFCLVMYCCNEETWSHFCCNNFMILILISYVEAVFYV